jgi:hypothetical protein
VAALKGRLDASGQISGFRKLKLTNCAPVVAWVERLCETHGLGISNETQLVGYGAIDAALWSNVVPAPNPPYAVCPPHGSSAAQSPVHCYGIVFSMGGGRNAMRLVNGSRRVGPAFWQNEFEFMSENKCGANHRCRGCNAARAEVCFFRTGRRETSASGKLCGLLRC